MALTDLTTVEYRNPEGWKILVDFILSTGNPIAIALNCEDINFVIFNYKDHVHIQFSDKNVKTQHQTEKILEGFNRPYNINLNHNESEVVFGTFKIVLRDNDESENTELLCKSCRHAEVLSRPESPEDGEIDFIFKCKSNMMIRDNECRNYEEI